MYCIRRRGQPIPPVRRSLSVRRKAYSLALAVLDLSEMDAGPVGTSCAKVVVYSEVIWSSACRYREALSPIRSVSRDTW